MPSKHYLFTLNNYTPEEVNTLKTHVYRDCTYLCFSEEVGESGTPHLQGYFQLSKQVKITTIKNWPAFSRMHFTSPFGSDTDNYTYCKGPYEKVINGVRKSKPLNDTFWEYGERQTMGRKVTQGKRNDLEEVKKAITDGLSYDEICDTHFTQAASFNRFIKERIQARDTNKELDSLREAFESASLRPWQEALVGIVEEEPNPRKIHWIWEATGNTGKSWMTKYLAAMYNACVLTVGRKADMAYIYSKNPAKVVVFDLSRTTEPGEGREHFLDGAYSLAEDLKNGMVISTKYDSTNILKTGCHVIFFANFPPDMTKWSSDRYFIKEI